MTEGWRTLALGEAFRTVTGSTPKKSMSEYYGDFMPFVKPPELLNGPLTSSSDGLSELGSREARVLPPGAVLVSCIGNLGKVGIATEELACNQQINAILPGCEHALPDYVFRFCTSSLFREQLEALASGTTIPIVSKRKFNTIRIPLPPLPEQERIVAILDEAFAAIATATANAEKNLANARELFESELNRVFTQQGDGWIERTLGEMSRDFGRGKSKHRPRNAEFLYGGNYPFVQTGDIRNSEHNISNFTQTYSEAGLSQSKLWPAGTLCITIAANIAETGILEFDACFPDSIIGMVPDYEKTNSGYVEYLLQFFKTELQQQGKGSAQDNINLGTFKRQKFPFAPLPEQQTIAAKLDFLAEGVLRLEYVQWRKLATLAELKHSLLHKAFAGELTADVKSADRAISEAGL
jgi:type I restriction enzyme, S subunit